MLITVIWFFEFLKKHLRVLSHRIWFSIIRIFTHTPLKKNSTLLKARFNLLKEIFPLNFSLWGTINYIGWMENNDLRPFIKSIVIFQFLSVEDDWKFRNWASGKIWGISLNNASACKKKKAILFFFWYVKLIFGYLELISHGNNEWWLISSFPTETWQIYAPMNSQCPFGSSFLVIFPSLKIFQLLLE